MESDLEMERTLRVFLVLDELPSQADEPHLPKATGFKVPETYLHPFTFAPSPTLQSGIPCWVSSPHLQREAKEFCPYNSNQCRR